jgi:histidinol dehydrogenase
MADPDSILPMCRHAGAVFIGCGSAEAFGDYGAGPNHTLPTSGRGRSSGGLSVFDFLRIRTWLRLDGKNMDSNSLAGKTLAGKEPAGRDQASDSTAGAAQPGNGLAYHEQAALAALAADTAILARAEGLEAHARSALARVPAQSL